MFFVSTSWAAARNPFKPMLPEIEEPEPVIEQIPQPVYPELNNQPPVQQNYPDNSQYIEQEPVQPIKIEPPQLTISGVVWNTNRPQAIINDQVVDIGDTISIGVVNETIKNTTKIVSISKSSIEIEYQGHTFQLTP